MIDADQCDGHGPDRRLDGRECGEKIVDQANGQDLGGKANYRRFPMRRALLSSNCVDLSTIPEMRGKINYLANEP